MEDGQTKRLPLCVRPQIRLKTETVDRRNESFNGVQRRPGNRSVLSNVTTEKVHNKTVEKSHENSNLPSFRQHRIHRRHTIRRRLHLHEQVGLHQPGRGHEKGGIHHPPRRRDYLAAAPVKGLVGDDSVQDLEFRVPDGLFAEGTLAGAPLEALHDGVLYGAQEGLVYLGRQRVVHKDVRSCKRSSGELQNDIYILKDKI